MTQKKNRFSPEMKARILREHFEEKASASELCEKYGMHRTAFYQWKKVFIESAVSIFSDKRRSQTTKDMERIKKLEEKLKQKESVISEIVSENIEYKKN